MFNGCNNITSLYFLRFKTCNIRNNDCIFNGCINIKEIIVNDTKVISKLPMRKI